MIKFDTKIQHLKYKVLSEVAKEAWNDNLDNISEIPSRISQRGGAPSDNEKHIIADRVKVAMGGDKSNPRVIEVIESACNKCPSSGYEVTNTCQGCLAHHCEDACRKGAIFFDENHVAHIDKSKCVNCGACAKACPFSAIVNKRRPCQAACKVGAMSIDENGFAKIDYDKCISCGACVRKCPFGAVADKSFILEVIDIIKKSENNSKYKVFAIVAPAIASQFSFAKLGQVVSGIKNLGFFKVVEAALGADMVAGPETEELVEKGFLTSSCCPAFVDHIHKAFPDMVPLISHNFSPMGALAKHIKETEKDSKVIFIGPCTAKKQEMQKEELRPYVDSCITFEELAALFNSKDIDITTLPEEELNDASYFGRIFARSGGLAEAVKNGLETLSIKDFELKPVVCDGIEECRVALLKKSKNVLDANFIEGMVCSGGCIGGAGCLTHGPKNKIDVDKHAKEANTSSK